MRGILEPCGATSHEARGHPRRARPPTKGADSHEGTKTRSNFLYKRFFVPSWEPLAFGSETACRARCVAGRSGLPVAEEMRVDEVVDDLLVGGLDLLQLNPHADAAIAPSDPPPL